MTFVIPDDYVIAFFAFQGTRNGSELGEAVDVDLYPQVDQEYRRMLHDALGSIIAAKDGLHTALGRLTGKDGEAEMQRLRPMIRNHHRALTTYLKAIAAAAGDASLHARAQQIEAAQAQFVEAWEKMTQAETDDEASAILERTLGLSLYKATTTVH
jgi:hypothetical protein